MAGDHIFQCGADLGENRSAPHESQTLARAAMGADGCTRDLTLLTYPLQFLDWRDEAKAAARNRLNHLLLGSVVSHCLARRVERIGQRLCVDHDIGPDRGMQLVTRDHAPAVAQEIEQQVEGFGLDMHRPSRPSQLPGLRDELEPLSEAVDLRSAALLVSPGCHGFA